MKNQQKATILGCNINLVNMQQAIKKVENIIREGTPSQVITLNAEIVYRAQQDPYLKELINSANLVTPDGIGIVWAAHKLGYKLEERVTGIDMLYSLCSNAVQKGWKIYLLGASPGVAMVAGERLCKIYPGLKICGSRDGYFKEKDVEYIVNEIKQKSPDILFVGLGAPKQEYWINKNKDKLGVPVCIGVGGSFDVIAGVKKRAPDILIKLNLEWLFRLVCEPKRLKRQLALPKFVLLILKKQYLQKNNLSW